MIPLVRRVQHLARRSKLFFVPVCITAGMAFAATWASGPPKAPRETPSITLSDLDGDGDLDMQTYTNESGQLWININRGADAGRLFFRVRAE